MSKKINNIVIIGGGAAGWLTAGLLSKEHPDKSITLIESADIGISGVGEGTWPSMRHTLQRIGIKETDFLQQCDASFKQGSKFINWRGKEQADNYYHPFMVPEGYNEYDVHAAWQQLFSEQKYADAMNVQSFVCQATLAPKQLNTPEYAGVTNYGYHLDAHKFAQFLTKHCVNTLNVKRILDNVLHVNNNAQGYIESVTTQNNGVINGDLFIDCSGSQGLLIAKHYQIPFLDQSHILFNNTAVAAQLPYESPSQDIASATLSTAQSAGWIWDIGLPTRRGIGYTFSDKYCDVETAVETLKSYAAQSVGIQQANNIETRTLRFTPGYREVFWHKNCVAIGMSQGFIEPLEASALAMVELSISMLSEQMPVDQVHMQLLRKRFNKRFRYRWKQVINFLKLHYVLSSRDDSSYWYDNHHPKSIPSELQSLLKLWQYQAPSRFDFIENEEIFSSASYQYVLYGMGFKTKQAKKLDNHTYQMAQKLYQLNRKKIAQYLQKLPTNRLLLEQLQRE
ncbi:tryptophan 7-halogenase [Pseudoalteromonas shioyasakiensis]|uniref:tryptophan halogenase family protein n=1 Tax=Pseudoalteromonas shioyasakiensis TaxID=1190813 RepID=UPI002118756A|nr:tryptophan halogenase family protein [Pseudoalteromonas shioyasakiensis]MCQ8880574.1 tryptophan 7-halogenase [Pseudoalteromonas shioyasakiensis]